MTTHNSNLKRLVVRLRSICNSLIQFTRFCRETQYLGLPENLKNARIRKLVPHIKLENSHLNPVQMYTILFVTADWLCAPLPTTPLSAVAVIAIKAKNREQDSDA